MPVRRRLLIGVRHANAHAVAAAAELRQDSALVRWPVSQWSVHHVGWMHVGCCCVIRTTTRSTLRGSTVNAFLLRVVYFTCTVIHSKHTTASVAPPPHFCLRAMLQLSIACPELCTLISVASDRSNALPTTSLSTQQRSFWRSQRRFTLDSKVCSTALLCFPLPTALRCTALHCGIRTVLFVRLTGSQVFVETKPTAPTQRKHTKAERSLGAVSRVRAALHCTARLAAARTRVRIDC
jgi:hypothetical protein